MSGQNFLSHIYDIKWSGILFFFIVTSLALGTADAEVIEVCPDGCDYSSISAGITAANPGDTVEVQSGNYVENVIVNKPVTLRGVDTGSGKPLIDADYNESGIKLIVDGIILEGFRVNNSEGFRPDIWAGIEVSSNNNTLANNTLAENEHGILVEGFGNNTLIGNEVINNKYGIKIKGCSENSVIDNYLGGNRYGILLISATNNDLQGNEAASGDYGILLSSSMNNKLRANFLHDNDYNFGAGGKNDIDASNFVDTKPIFYWIGFTNATIDTSSNAGIIYCQDCDNISIKGLLLKKNIFGIYLYNTTHCIIENTSLTNNSYGIRLDASDEITIRNNSITDNSIDGISLSESNRNLIEGNELRGNKQTGINLNYSDDSIIRANKAFLNNLGLTLALSGFNSIYGNNLSQNEEANLLVHEYSYNNRIDMNNLTESSDAIRLESALMNEITRNTIYDNYNGIYISGGNKNNISRNTISDNEFGLSYVIFSEFIQSDNILFNNSKNIIEIPPGTTKSPPGVFGVIPRDQEGKKVAVLIDPTPLKAIAYLGTECLGPKKTIDYYPMNDDKEYYVKMLKDETVVFEVTFKVSDSKDQLITIRPEKSN